MTDGFYSPDLQEESKNHKLQVGIAGFARQLLNPNFNDEAVRDSFIEQYKKLAVQLSPQTVIQIDDRKMTISEINEVIMPTNEQESSDYEDQAEA